MTDTGRSSSMAVVNGVAALEPSLGRLFVVIGVFDGLHLGHQYLLRELVREAARLHARPTVLTFDHHPDEILTGTAPPLLCDPDERLERLAAGGVEVTIVQHFDQTLRETRYDDFVRGIASRVDLAGFLMTPESAFGFERAGTPETVAALGRALGYEVVVVPPFTLDGRRVTSSAVRAAIAAGDLLAAAAMLGRPVAISGEAGAGAIDDERGTTVPVGFQLPVALPPAGTYGCRLVSQGVEGVARVRVGPDGTVSVHAPVMLPAGAPVRVELPGWPSTERRGAPEGLAPSTPP